VLRQLHIQNFRALRDYRMNDLSRVNLLVGTNNCGKTSVLEAIHVLSAPGAAPVWDALMRRGEVRLDGEAPEVELAHLVHKRSVTPGILFSIEATNDVGSRSLVAHLLGHVPGPREPVNTAIEGPSDVLQLVWNLPESSQEQLLSWTLTPRGGLFEDTFVTLPRLKNVRPAGVHFLTTEGLTQEYIVSLLDETVLTPHEADVIRALQTIEPGIERLASVGASRARGRGGIAMLVNGERIPIGSMGDGIWRLLGIALALVRAEGGVLLVDEIDTGLHYTVLVDMWRLVYETATRLNVQVFATTHSRDCYEALAAITEPGRHDISLQRIERDQPVAVAFSESEIRAAAERGIEVR
jgi:hypothetical protein